MGFDLNILSWLAFAVIVGSIAYVGIRMLRQRMEQLRYQEQIAELEFQENLLANMSGGGLGEDNRFLQSENVAAVANEPVAPVMETDAANRDMNSVQTGVSQPLDTPQTDDGPIAADVAASGVMKQLEAAGLVTTIDGYVPVHGNPKGAVMLRLRNGKSALLVPQMESEAFLRHNSRRADMIIMVGHDGKGVVVSTLEHFLAENMSGL